MGNAEAHVRRVQQVERVRRCIHNGNTDNVKNIRMRRLHFVGNTGDGSGAPLLDRSEK